MKNIIEHFGVGFLQLVSGTLMITLIFSQVWGTGALSQIVSAYMSSICG